MRIRTIKPEFWKNEDLARLPEFTRLLAIALLNYADDEGYFPANPTLIRGDLFPFTEDSVSIHDALSELSKCEYIFLAKGTNGRLYGLIVNFAKHQRINRLTPSKIKDLVSFSDSSVSIHCGVAPGTGNREGNREVEGMQGNDATASVAPVSTQESQSVDSNNVLDVEKLQSSSSKRKLSEPDDVWIAGLKVDPAYTGIDIDRQLAKAKRWCAENRQNLTRKRVIRWLNRIDTPLHPDRASPNGANRSFSLTEKV